MTETLKRVFGAPYRIFFLAAGLYGVFALLVWEIWLGVHAAGGMVSQMPFAAAPHLWHAHEMIFGYAAGALGGFLLTAVPNWTGAKGSPHAFISTAAGLWLAGRLAIWFSGALPGWAVAAIDLSFLPLLALNIASMLIKRPKPQNMAFLAFVSLLWVGNLMVHLEWLGLTGDTLATGLRTGLFALCLMIAVLGGRVTPAFTRNAMNRAGEPEATWPRPNRWVDRAAILCIAMTALAYLFGAPDGAAGTVAIIGGALQILRLAYWRPGWTLDQPILWALHLGMAMLGLGLILWGLAAVGLGSEVAALHVLGIGAVGGMTLAVMSRAILGHTGRELVAPAPVALAYGLIVLAAALRWLASAFAGELYFPAMLVTGGLWIAAFTLFVVTLWPAFTRPRQQRSA